LRSRWLQWLSAADGVSCAEVIAYDDASLTSERLDVAAPTRAAVSRCPPCAAGSISTRARWRPHHVAAPQIPVQPRRQLIIVEIACGTSLHHRIDGLTRRRVKAHCRAVGHR
jgi:hypothetical protein